MATSSPVQTHMMKTRRIGIFCEGFKKAVEAQFKCEAKSLFPQGDGGADSTGRDAPGNRFLHSSKSSAETSVGIGFQTLYPAV